MIIAADAASTTYADTVATLALIAALGSLTWQIVGVWLDRPRISVTGRLAYAWDSSATTGVATSWFWDLSTEVVNDGRAATGVAAVYWEFELADGRTIRIVGSDPADGTRTLERFENMVVLGGELHPELPLTLPRFGHAEWLFSREARLAPQVAAATRGRPVVEYAARRRRPRRDRAIDENPSRRTEYGDWRAVNVPEDWPVLDTVMGKDGAGSGGHQPDSLSPAV